MSYSEHYTKINNGKGWMNEPSNETALEADNLNHMDEGIKENDRRITVIGNDAMYAQDVADALYGQPTYDPQTGVITFPKKGGGSVSIDTALERVVTNFHYDKTTQQLILTLEDGSTQSIDLSDFIQETEFDDSTTIAWSVVNHKAVAVVKAHSIGANELQQNYLADLQGEVAKGKKYADDAQASADDSADSALLAKSWAVGNTGVRQGENYDNAEYWCNMAQAVSNIRIATTTLAGIVKPDGTTITVDPDGTIHGVPQTICDTILSTSSTNPVENRVITRFIFEVLDELAQGRVITPLTDDTGDAIIGDDEEFMYGSVPLILGGNT